MKQLQTATVIFTGRMFAFKIWRSKYGERLPLHVVNGKITSSTEYLITSVPTTLCCKAKYELSQLNHSRNKTFFLSIEFINFLHQIADNHTVPEQSPITRAAQDFLTK